MTRSSLRCNMLQATDIFHRRWLAVLLLVTIALPMRAQVVTFTPAFPSADQPIEIIFHADQGSGGLQGFTGTVYAHAGLITSASTSATDWKYVITQWGENIPKNTLERIAPDTYRLYIADIPAYYDFPSGTAETIKALAFVFRNADGSREGKDVGGTDIYIPLYKGISTRLLSPAIAEGGLLFLEEAGTVDVAAVAQADTLDAFQLQQGGTVLFETTNDTLSTTLDVNDAGRTDYEIVAFDRSGATDTTRFSIMLHAPPSTATRPPGLQDGVTVSGTTASFSLFAPYKEHVYLIGDFNDWQLDPAYQLHRDASGNDAVHYWISIDGLDLNRTYGFQYVVDGKIRVTDPYVERILDPLADPYLDAIDPELPAYPTGKTSHIVGLFSTKEEAFAWTDQDFVPPAPHEMVVYELLLRDFLEDASFEVLVDTLDYLARLGVNAIELMPVNEFDGNDSWGYNPAFHLALDKAYGTPTQFKRFVNEAHNRGIAVLLDVVYNHATGQSPLIRLYSQSETGDPSALPSTQSIYANTTARHDFNVFNDLNHLSPATQYWLDRANRYWMDTYHVDGYRFDLTKGFMQNGSFYEYNNERVGLLQRMVSRLWEAHPDAIVIFEHLGANNEEQALSSFGTNEGRPGIFFWAKMTDNYNEATMGYHNSGASNLSWGYYKNRGWAHPNLVTYMESHDEQWLMYKNRAFGNSGANGYNVRNLKTALERMRAAGAFLFMYPGAKMIWQFGELGYGYGDNGEQCLEASYCPTSAPPRTGRKPIRWDYRGDADRYNLYTSWSALINLRKAEPIFHDPSTTVNMNTNGAMKYITLQHASMQAVLAGNFDVNTQDAAYPFPSEGPWYDAVTGEIRYASQDDAPRLLPGEFRLFTTEDLGTPLADAVTVAIDDHPLASEAFSLSLYPNPARNVVTLTRTQSTEAATIQLVDVLGRTVQMASWPREALTTTLNVDALASGTYFVRMSQGARVDVKPILVLP